MSKIYSVDYDLHRPGQNYDALDKALKAYPGGKCLQTKWIIQTTETAAQVRDKLVQNIDQNDKLIVTRLAGEAAWYGLSDKWGEWLKTQLAA